MKRKYSIILMCLISMLILGACRNDEEAMKIQMSPILSYTSDKSENIKFVRTKEYDGITIKEFTDSRFFYEVTPEGRLMTIFLRTTPTNVTPNIVSKEDIRFKTEDNLKRLDYDIEKFKTNINYSDSKKQYETVSREMQDIFFTGNNVYIQYTSDGNLISISFKYEDPLVLKNEDKISVDEGKDVIVNYFATNADTEKYAPFLKKEMIRHDVDVYNSKKVYNFYFSLETEEHGVFDFVYVVSTDSGIILYRKEPRR